MANGHHWQCWIELPEDASIELKVALRLMCESLGKNYTSTDIILCEGSHAKCLKFWKHNRTIAGIETHLGYALKD